MGKTPRKLTRQEGYVGGTAQDNTLFIKVVLYRSRASISWKDLEITKMSINAGATGVRVHQQSAGAQIYDKFLYQARLLLENCLAKLKQYHAIAFRSEKTSQKFLGTIYLAASAIWLN